MATTFKENQTFLGRSIQDSLEQKPLELHSIVVLFTVVVVRSAHI